MKLIGLDVGTTGCKAVVFDEDGTEYSRGFREYDIVTDENGKAEQDPEEVWRLCREALTHAVGSTEHRSDIAAISISVQGDAIMAVDVDGNALCPAQLGMDYRPVEYARLCAERFGDYELFHRTGMRPHALNSFVKLLWLRDHYPDAYRRAAKIVTYADFILAKLGAAFFIDLTMASRTMAFNLDTRTWDAGILSEFNVSESLFSEVVPSGTPVGTLDPELARELGLSEKIVIVAGAHDQPAGGVGAGVVGDGTALVSTGTAEVLSAAFAEPALGRKMYSCYYPCYIHAIPGQFFTFALNHVGGLLLRWYRDNFGGVEIADAQARGLDPYDVILSKLPPRPSRIMVLPHFNGSGTPWCDMDSLGAIVGLSLSSTRHEIVRAILESQTYELKINLRELAASGVSIKSLVASGGGARSTEWLRIKSSVLNMPVRTLRTREAASLGAAILAGFGIGLFPSIEDGINRLVHVDRVYEPDPETVEAYEARFRSYEQIYPTLKPLNTQLRKGDE
ncbi:MAG TPA: FGGY-family carbohydrate kinase [Spirochaetia bacterium]|nr:FGGY-family carbohydrate kinase [Spirochaetia bacterium]